MYTLPATLNSNIDPLSDSHPIYMHAMREQVIAWKINVGEQIWAHLESSGSLVWCVATVVYIHPDLSAITISIPVGARDEQLLIIGQYAGLTDIRHINECPGGSIVVHAADLLSLIETTS
jgi:hypothetical protein